ncbi:MAG: IS4 family transposase, partial [Chloroflexota bacterium]|nr:IS4 family transposase [Chloroflexota bacterium]
MPRQANDLAALKGIYRVLDEEDVTFAALMTPHWQQTRQAAAHPPLVLLVQDTTELNYTRHPAADDLGPIGNEHGRGYLLHSVLAVHPESREVLGLLHQEPFLRKSAPPGEHTSQRLKRERESQVWGRAVEAVGSSPDGTTWVHVGDRGSDLFPFLSACREQQVHFLVRASQNRRVDRADDTRDYLLDVARQLPGQGTREVDLPARAGCAARRATLQVATTALTLVPPVQDPHYPPLAAWVIRVWEVDPPATVEEPVEWVLVTSVATTTVEQAWE